MRRCYGFVLTAVCAAVGCQSSPQGLDPFLGPQRISPPVTGSAVPNGAAPYYPPGGPVVTPGTPSNSITPTSPGGAPAGGTYNFNPSSARTDGASNPSRALVPQTAASSSAIALPGKAASWSTGSSNESVKIVEPPAGVTQASFSSSTTRTPAPVEAGPLVDITNLPDPKRK